MTDPRRCRERRGSDSGWFFDARRYASGKDIIWWALVIGWVSRVGGLQSDVFPEFL